MRRYLLTAILCSLLVAAHTQNVAINNDGSAPDPKAMLDVKAIGKGALLPRMTANDRANITGSVPLGLIVFQTDGERGFYYNASALPGTPNWKKLTDGDEVFWQYGSPNYLFNNGAYNVGIGTPTPQAKLHVSNAVAEKLRLENTTVLAADVSNELYFKTGSYFTGAIKTIGADASRARMGLFTFSTVNASGLKEAISIIDDGKVGIGATDPEYKLDVAGRLRLRRSTEGTAGIWFNNSDNAPMALIAAPNDSTLAFLGPGTGGTYKMSIDVKNGQVGIGTVNPDKGKLEVAGTVGSVSALFGKNTNGVSIENNWPGIAFNSYYNGNRFAIAGGYGSWVGQNPGNGDIYIQSSNANIAANAVMPTFTRMLINNAGNIGVQGNTNPQSPLSFANTTGEKINFYEVNANANYGIGVQGAQLQVYAGGAGDAISFGYGSSNNFTERVRMQNAYTIINNGRLQFKGSYGSISHGIDFTNNAGTASRGFMGMLDDNTMGFYGYGGTGWSLLWDVNDGSLRVGTAQKASGYLLNVGGKAIAEEVRVQLRASWPDYVFKKGYNLMPLSQLENFVRQNNHLPNIPKAEVLEKEGTDLGEMQRKMMEKIEELTLYVIEQDKRIRQLERQLKTAPKQ